jgi:transposase InsO family protein
MSIANPLWGAPRIHGELLKLGIDIGQTSVAKYMVRRRTPPSQGWKTFLRNHADGIAAMDLFVVPTVSFRLLYGLLIMGHGRRQILWFGVTAQPTAEWIANQLTAACGWEQISRDLIHDRDACYGAIFIRRVRSLGIRDHPTSARSPWQNGYAERLIGSIRRECLDHIVVTGEQHLGHILKCYMEYYNAVRTHLSLGKDAPIGRAIQRHGRIEVRPVITSTTIVISQNANANNSSASLRICPWGTARSTTFNVPDRRYRTLVGRDNRLRCPTQLQK